MPATRCRCLLSNFNKHAHGKQPRLPTNVSWRTVCLRSTGQQVNRHKDGMMEDTSTVSGMLLLGFAAMNTFSCMLHGLRECGFLPTRAIRHMHLRGRASVPDPQAANTQRTLTSGFYFSQAGSSDFSSMCIWLVTGAAHASVAGSACTATIPPKEFANVDAPEL